MGDSFHPGGLALTTRLAQLAGVERQSEVLDLGSGRGVSAVHLAHTVGCRVAGLTLEEDGILAGKELATLHGVDDRVRFDSADIRHLEFEPGGFDVALLECVFSIIDTKEDVLRCIVSLLRPGGRIGLTDVTVSGPLPPQLHGVLATVGCVGGALSLDGYRALLSESGFVVDYTANCNEVATSFVKEIKGKLLMAEIASKLGQLPIVDGLIVEGQRLMASVEEQVRLGVLSYGLIVAHKPSDSDITAA